MKQSNALRERIEQLEASDAEIDRMLDDADERGQKMDEEIKGLRSVWFMNGKKGAIDS